jgi:hypothetical protein
VCEFLGAFLARALLDGSVPARAARLRHVTLGGLRLCDAFWALLLGAPLGLADVAHVSAATHRSLRCILELAQRGGAEAERDAAVAALCLGSFEHAVHAHGAPPGAPPALLLPLRPGGGALPICGANAAEFVMLKAQCVLHGAAARQLDAACRGFYSLVPLATLRAAALTPRALRRLLCGGGDGFDVATLRARAAYARPYSAGHAVVGWLWDVLSQEGPACQSAFLEFCTGASALPAAGVGALRGDGPPLTVAPAELRRRDCAAVRLPSAHTCSNTLELPPFESRAQLRDKLLQALAHKNTYGFG